MDLSCKPLWSLAESTQKHPRQQRDQFVPHPVATAGPDLFEHIGFVRTSLFSELDAPWPRKQEVPKDAFRVPTADDLVVAVSHAWRYQSHPDPMGNKSDIVCQLAARAAREHTPKGGTLAFYDFLSVSQRPFLDRQADRTAEEQAQFKTALAAMPRIFLLADAVLHVEVAPGVLLASPEEDTTYDVSVDALDAVVLAEIGPTVHVVGRRSDQALCPPIAPLDYVVKVGGMSVGSLKDLAHARYLADKAGIPSFAQLKCAPFGRKNEIPAGEKGWVYLERFCSMIKVAMVDEAEHGRVVFSNSPAVLDQIFRGGAALREAAKGGEAQLKLVLEVFFRELKQKQFASVCADAAVAGDCEVVAGIMKELVSRLPEHWAHEVARQRQRQLVLAVNRGDAVATRQLLSLKGDPNAQDGSGMTCLHNAAQRGDLDVVRVLLGYCASCSLQDRLGQTPAHLIGLWANLDTVHLFDALAPESVLRVKNKAGVSVFERFWAWSMTACDGRPFEPMYKRLQQAAAVDENLKGTWSREVTPCVEGHACNRVTLHVGAHIPVEVWEPWSGESDMCVLYLGMPTALPWAMQRPAVDALASHISTTYKVKFFALTHGAPYGPKAGSSLHAFQADLLQLIRELPLTSSFVMVDNSFGSATALLWSLQERLAAALVVNAAGYFSEEYQGSAAHQKFCEVMAQRAIERRRDRDVEALCKASLSNFVFGEPEFLDAVGSDLRQAVAAAGDEFWDYTASMNEWSCTAMTEAMAGRTELDLPAALACSAHAPVMHIQASTQRLQKFLPEAHVTHIPASKGWWELDQPNALTDELASLMRRVAIDC